MRVVRRNRFGGPKGVNATYKGKSAARAEYGKRIHPHKNHESKRCLLSMLVLSCRIRYFDSCSIDSTEQQMLNKLIVFSYIIDTWFK